MDVSGAQSLAVVGTVPALREAVAGYRARGERVALVPTMGALHEGHFALLREARRQAARVVVSIFVNPTQFAPGEDLATYPRTFRADVEGLEREGADLVWAPASVREIYPDGFATVLRVGGPATVGLEDAFRPHFFEGVATVVAKLLIQCLPDVALFGEKDFQQLRVVQRMSRDLDIPTQILGLPTVRAPDGLALSSRNAYLSPTERAVAPQLYATLRSCAARIAGGEQIADANADGRRNLERAGFVLDYFEARHAETLRPVPDGAAGPIRLLAAAKLGATRLIDNIAV